MREVGERDLKRMEGRRLREDGAGKTEKGWRKRDLKTLRERLREDGGREIERVWSERD